MHAQHCGVQHCGSTGQAALRFESVLTNNLFYEPLLGCRW